MPEDSPLVLIVDDNERNLKLARDVLLAAGFRTAEAETGAEALAKALASRPDVVLIDLRLPDMDGAEVAELLTADPRTEGIPLVAFSSLALAGTADWLARACFAGAIEKPIDVAAFPEQVRSYCVRREG